jgi:hypothetical protein
VNEGNEGDTDSPPRIPNSPKCAEGSRINTAFVIHIYRCQMHH